MSSLVEIQKAIIELPEDERQALSAWLASQNVPTLAPEDEKRLLESLDHAMRDLDDGKGIPLKKVRGLVRSWAGK
jgi:hypothetical protein